MDFDWQSMLDFVVQCEEQQQHQQSKDVLTPPISPVLEEPQPFTSSSEPLNCNLEPYDGVETVSQALSKNADGDFFGYNYYEEQMNLYTFEKATYATLENICQPAAQFTEQPQLIQPIRIDIVGYVENNQVYPVDSIVTPPPETVPDYNYFGQQQWPTPQEVPVPVQKFSSQPSPPKQQNQPEQPKRTRTKRKLKAFVSEWTCEPCTKSFKSRRGLIQHNNQHHSGPMPHGCSKCGKRFKDFQRMQEHYQRHLIVDKPHKCFHCPRQFCRSADLQRHIDLHHGQARYKCKVCGKPFDRADHVEDHELSHENGTVKKSYRKRANQAFYG